MNRSRLPFLRRPARRARAAATARIRRRAAALSGRPDRLRRIEVLGALLASVVAAVVAAGSLVYTQRSNEQVREELAINRDQLDLSRDELAATREGQITDRYTAAVVNLGDDAIDVRLGGIYALQRIMTDSTRDHPSILNVLSTYIRNHATAPPGTGQDTTRPDVQAAPSDVLAALTVLATRDPAHDQRAAIDVSDSYLAQANIGAELDNTGEPIPDTRSHLSNANLSHTVWTGANLVGADLTNANLHEADLTGALLIEADLTGADLAFTNLTDASLSRANLTNLWLLEADLTGVTLDGADLRGATVGKDQLLAARLTPETRLPADLANDPDIQEHIAELGYPANLTLPGS
ncbi:pentapeptide repeat-containing protein [Streptomyces sp. URMC 129]|uniref:pentapeptide repeat-containing protein n=1 Tax=Streptomyces sp. URMC 129 TaxID=3423407 RepID=UPI003F193EE7